MESVKQPVVETKPFLCKGMRQLDPWYTEEWLRQQSEAESRQIMHGPDWYAKKQAEMKEER